jgi:hypothetical protein
LPGQITTEVLRSPDSQLVIDLIAATFYGKATFAAGTSGYENITDKPDIAGAIDDASTSLKVYIDGTFADEIISEMEAANIEAYLNVLAAEKAKLNAEYTTLYNNPALEGSVERINLNTA